MRRGNEDAKAKAMEKFWEAIDGYKKIFELNPDQNPRNDLDLTVQLDQLGGQNAEIVTQIEAMVNLNLERNGNFTQQGDELLRQLTELESGIQASYPQNQVGQVLAGPDVARRIPLGGAGVNELALRELLSQFLRNLDIGRQGRADGVRGEAGAGADGGAAGAGAFGAAGGAGAGAFGGAGGAGDGGAGAVVESEELESLIARVTEVLTRRTDEFRRMQEERDQARAAQTEAEVERRAVEERVRAEAEKSRKNIADTQLEVALVRVRLEAARAAERRAAEAARAAADARAEAARAEATARAAAEAELARAQAERDAAKAAEAALAQARAAQAEAERRAAQATTAQAAAEDARAAAQAERDAAEKRAQIADQIILENRLNILKENEDSDSDETKELKKQISNYLYGIQELRSAIRDDDEKIKKLLEGLKEAEDEAQSGVNKNEILKRHNRALQDYVDFLKSKDPSLIFPSRPESPPPPPGPDKAKPVPAVLPIDPKDAPVPVAVTESHKKPNKILDDDQKKRNALYLRQNFYETAIPESKKEEGSNLFLVITDEVGDGSRKIDETRPLNSYVLSDRAYFFRALNNEVDFFSGNGVRICFMKSRTQIKVGECDITEQSFIDINDEIAKTRIFIDDNGRKKIEDYRLLLEEKFKEFLRENKDKECNESTKNDNLLQINSLNGLADLNQLKRVMMSWGTDPVAVKVKVFGDDLSTEEAIAKKAKELADDTLANRFKSGIIGVEENKNLGAARAAAEYGEEAFGFIKVVRSKKSKEPVRVFVGETPGPMTANIWDIETKSYVQISLKTTQIGEGVNQKTVIDGIEEVKQIAQNGEIIKPPTSRLKIDLFIEKTGDRSGLFPDSAPGPDQGSELQMLQKIEIRSGSKVVGGGGYYLTNGFAHQKEGKPSNEKGDLFIGKIKTTDTTQQNNRERKIELYETFDTKKIGKIKIEDNRDKSKCKEKLISEFMEKAIPEYNTPDDQSKHVQGIALRYNGQMNISEIGVSNNFDNFLSHALPCATASQNPAGNVRITQKTFSKTSAPKPANSPSGASAGPAQGTSLSSYPWK